MINEFKKHIDTDLPFLKGKKLLLTASGGVDSVVLTHLFKTLGFDCYIAHCNFKLRDSDSDLDESFIKDFAQTLNIKTFTQQFDTVDYALKNKLSIQTAARNIRYKWVNELLINQHLDYIITAHHADDNLETFLINLTRSSGLDGLIGIPEINGKIIRPLLSFSKKQILEYAQIHGIKWREDSTNREVKYVRNKIRHKIIPVLKEINPNILKSFEKTSKNLLESRQIINDKIEEISSDLLNKEGDFHKIEIYEVLKLKKPKAYLYQILKQFNFSEWNNVYGLLSAQTGKSIHSKTHTLLKNRGHLLIFSNDEEQDRNQQFEIGMGIYEIDKNIKVYIRDVKKKQVVSKKCIVVNKNLVTFPMIIRKWGKGDFFYPTGMKGKKKVSKFFKDEKLSKIIKEKTWILCTKKNEIIWIVGMRQDRRFLPDVSTEQILKISI